MKRGFYSAYFTLQLGLVAGLFALVDAPRAVGGAETLTTPTWRIVIFIYIAVALALSIRMAVQRLPQACAPLARATRQLDRLDPAQRVYPALLVVVLLVGTAWLALWMLSQDILRAFWVEPQGLRAERAARTIRFILFEAFMLLDAVLVLVCLCIVARRHRQASRQTHP